MTVYELANRIMEALDGIDKFDMSQAEREMLKLAEKILSDNGDLD